MNQKARLKTLALLALFTAFVAQNSTAAPPPKNDDNDSSDPFAPKVIFVTNTRYNGDLVSAAMLLGNFVGVDGLDAADHICQYHAKDAGLKGKFKAVLSSSTENASARISTSMGPYRLVDGIPVAANYSDLFSTSAGASTTPPLPAIALIHAVRHDEFGADIVSGGPDYYFEAWTGSRSTGAAILTNTPGPGVGSVFPELTTCEDWTSSEVRVECESFTDPGVCGSYGVAWLRDDAWLDGGRGGCDQERRLYCAEQ
jgi:hypothetical protein